MAEGTAIVADSNSGIEQFCHREAIIPLPTYASQRVSGLAKLQERRWAIRRRLGDDQSGLGWGPLKPKWMRWKTFERYERLDDQLAELEDRTWSPLLRKLAAQGQVRQMILGMRDIRSGLLERIVVTGEIAQITSLATSTLEISPQAADDPIPRTL